MWSRVSERLSDAFDRFGESQRCKGTCGEYRISAESMDWAAYDCYRRCMGQSPVKHPPWDEAARGAGRGLAAVASRLFAGRGLAAAASRLGWREEQPPAEPADVFEERRAAVTEDLRRREEPIAGGGRW